MKISKLIIELKQIKDKHGDLPIYQIQYDRAEEYELEGCDIIHKSPAKSKPERVRIG